MKFEYLTRCTELSQADVPDLHKMVNEGIEISFNTFRRACNWAPIARELGYRVGHGGRELHIKDDWAVRFHRSFWCGKPCVYMKWSAIEFIFVEPEPA